MRELVRREEADLRVGELTAVALAVSSYLTDPAMTMVVLTVAAIGVFCCFGVFWTLPTAWLSGTAAAGGIALINSIGNLAGFGGPYLIGWVKEATGQTSRFLKVHEEYKKAPQVTRQRMYLETMERLLGGTDKVILDAQGGQGVVPYLPLDQLQRRSQTGPGSTGTLTQPGVSR